MAEHFRQSFEGDANNLFASPFLLIANFPHLRTAEVRASPMGHGRGDFVLDQRSLCPGLLNVAFILLH